MGYYDGYDGNLSSKNRNLWDRIGIGLIGVAAGGLIMYWGVTDGNLFTSNNNNAPTNNYITSSNKAADDIRSIDISTAMTEAAANVHESVVGVSNMKSVGDFFSQGTTTQEQGSGSGVIYKKEGNTVYIVTNNHVIESADTLEITLSNGEKKEAKLVGRDTLMDLAVISITTEEDVNVAEFGDSGQIKLAEPVIAIGNPLGLELSGSITQGIVSGIDRLVPVYNEQGSEIWSAVVIQTDAAINPGNSGGALVNLEGQVIGINSMKVSQSAAEGIGFAIPINNVVPIIEELEKSGVIARPYLGIELSDISGLTDYSRQKELGLPENVTNGIVIMKFSADSPAQQAGLKQFDVVVELAGEKINSLVDFKKILYSVVKPGETVELKYYRDGSLETTNVTVGSYTDQ